MILLDTDVLVDVALDREDYADSAARLLDRVENGEVRAAVAWHSMSNLYYLVAPAHGGVRTRDFIVQLVSFVDVAKTGTEEMRYAAGLPLADFEDAMQVAAARACGARWIVTRNLRDYTRSPIPAISPSQALTELA
ncbi:MAG: PIN domain-containing protein [Acidimicrobiaceae bacterium]|nr:PIN domain-containing protein [Acidimicrobiaceae bacterium]MXY12414.1 PIN domain-containing protein [Acidimicrobiaceae bacterium]MXZ63948.1 PIN domain-containing protein [Acidimicrobiaceae bacterium]MYF34131.1 PIN domain-containing protein [Acidimicrobiaceae bacterium]MYG79606.1 PIN domain-containing protein [Acidimicrobiaceae bacterium]